MFGGKRRKVRKSLIVRGVKQEKDFDAGLRLGLKNYSNYRAKESYIENRKSSSEAKRKKIKTSRQKKKEAQDARKKQASVKARSGTKGFV